MKKLLNILLGSLMVILLIGCSNTVDDETSDKYISAAKEVVEKLQNENYEEIYAQLDSTMKASLSTEQMAELGPIIEESGEFQSFDKQSIEEKDGFYVVVLVAKYSDQNRVYTVSFNSEDEIAGLFIK